MKDWIQKMNEMFAMNIYTDDRRVFIRIIDEDKNIVCVHVVGETDEIVNLDGLTDYGAMMVIMATVDRLYNDGKTIMLRPDYTDYT